MNKIQMVHLVERAQNGSAEAFAQIYSIYFDSVYYLALKLIRNEFDAKDVAQETMMQLYKTLKDISRKDSLTAYINRIAYNCSISLLRKRKEVLLADEADTVFDNIPEDDESLIPHKTFEQRETRQALISLIEELNDTLKPVIILFYYNQLSIRQIAEVLDIRESAVKKRLVRGRESLKKHLEKTKSRTGVFGIVFTPVLLRVVKEDAKSIYTAQAKREIWGNICKELNFSDAVIASTMPIASADSNALASSIRMARITKGGIAVGTTAAVAAAAVFMLNPSLYILDKPTPLSGEPPAVQEFLAPSGSSPDGNILSPSREAASSWDGTNSSALPEEKLPGTSPPETAPDASPGVSFPENPPDESSRTDYFSSEEDSEDSDSSSDDEPVIEGESAANVSSVMRMRENILNYPLGEILTEERILSDSGAVATDKNGNIVKLRVTKLHTVDTNRHGHYSIHIQTIGHNPFFDMEVVVIIEE